MKISEHDTVSTKGDNPLVGVCIGSVFSLAGVEIFLIEQPGFQFFAGTYKTLQIVKKFQDGFKEETVEVSNAEGKHLVLRVTRYPPTPEQK